ncbi:MAG TPA: hypothetical protein VK932_01730 [Kofleriaceae bacterium]|nr:hypothetical protein [Kofleriaceae bacterium]
MKQLSLARSLALALALALLAACGGSAPPASSPPSTGEPPSTGGCAQEIAIRCANGVDGCIDGRTTEHVCVPADATLGPSCELEIAMVCPEGQIDGCLRTPPVSARHVCVYN